MLKVLSFVSKKAEKMRKRQKWRFFKSILRFFIYAKLMGQEKKPDMEVAKSERNPMVP